MDFCSADGAAAYDAVVREAAGLLVCLDFDGTLAPIVEDPTAARIHPDAGGVLEDLVARVRAVAVVTGRPARQALALGGLDEIGDRIDAAGHDLVVLGQYGLERWSLTDRRVVSPPPPAGLASLLSELPRLLREADATSAWVEEKGIAVAVHTRRMPDPRAAYDRILPVLVAAAARRGLAVEPGRLVVEVRSTGMDKGRAVRGLVEEFGARAVVFVGDDRGDVPAFETVRDLRSSGLPGLAVCSGSEEEPVLRDLADLVVPGPAGVMAFLRDLAAALG